MPISRRLDRERTDFKQVTTWVVVGGCGLALLAGLAAFALSFRPSRFELPPGSVLVYRLATTTTELSSDNREGRLFSDERTVTLIGLDDHGETALLADEARGRDRITLQRIDADGSVQPLDAAGRPRPSGRAIGLFDFNLLALPPSASEQSWEVQLTYATLPPAKHLVQARVKRSKSSSNPEFQLKFQGTLEWPENNAYRQIKDLTCTYRYRSSHRAVDRAEIKAIYAMETPEGAIRRYRVATVLEMMDQATSVDDGNRLKPLAHDCAAAQEALADPDIGVARRRELATALRGADSGVARLRALAARLSDDVQRQPPPKIAVPSQSAVRYQIQVAVGPDSDGAKAQHLAQQLATAGMPSKVEPAAGNRLRVVVGPYDDKDPRVLERLALSFPYLKPLWMEVERQ